MCSFCDTFPEMGCDQALDALCEPSNDYKIESECNARGHYLRSVLFENDYHVHIYAHVIFIGSFCYWNE